MTILPIQYSTISTETYVDVTPFGTYALDPIHSIVGFEVPHLSISNIEGRFKKFDGTLVLADPLEASKVEAKIEISSVDTAESARDKHLMGPDFFDGEKFPYMSFTSTSFFGTADKLKINGKLTIKGIMKDVIFDAKLSKEVTDPWGKKRVAVSGVTKIYRKDFGLTWNNFVDATPLVGEQVTIVIKAEGIKK